MENRSTAIVAIAAFLFMTACISASSAQALAPGPSLSSPPSSPEDECLTKLLNMSDCLSYVIEGSNVTVPDKACCPELAGLVDSNPLCLCQLLGKSDSFGIKIDLTRALKLPSVCRVTTPPVSLCSVVGVPIGAPSPSQGSMSPAAGVPIGIGAPSPSQGSMSPGVQPPGGLAASPTAGNNNGAASGNTGSVQAILVGLAFAFLI